MISLITITKQFKKKRLGFICIVSVIVFFGATLFISSFQRAYDNSHSKNYSLSAPTNKILNSIHDSVTICFFASSSVPAKLSSFKIQAQNLLNEYQKQNEHVHVIVLDPQHDSDAAKKAKEVGISITSSYFGIVVNYRDKQQLIPQITDITNLEYSVTSAIYKLTSEKQPQVGIIGYNEQTTAKPDKITSLRYALSQQSNVQLLQLSSQSAQLQTVPALDAVLAFDTGTKVYTLQEIEALKKYLNHKGNIIVFADGVWVSGDLTQVHLAKHALFDLIKDYGLQLNKDLILSTSYESVQFNNGVVSFKSPYPFWIKTGSINKKFNISNVSHLTFPWVSSITFLPHADFTIVDLVKTEPQSSWQQPTNFNVLPVNIKEPVQKQLTQFVLAAESKKKGGGTLIVIANARFVTEEFVKRGNDNLEFILNTVNNIVAGDSLSGIPQRDTH